MQTKDVLIRFLRWRIRYIPQKQYMMILSALIGICVGFGAFLIKKSVWVIQYLLTLSFSNHYHNYLYFAYPAIGILIVVVIIKYLIRDRVGHGIPSVLYAISKNSGIMKRHNMFSSILTSAITVGFGGSVGLEGPTVATGAAIGSNIGRFLRLNYKNTILLLGCACAAAMAAIFKAPIAAVVFAVEVIMLDLTLGSIIPLLISSVTAALTSYLLVGQNVLYSFQVEHTFDMANIPWYILLALFTGILSVYFTRVYMLVGRLFEKLTKWYVKIVVGGSILGLLVFLFPSLFGEGYEVINSCLKGDFSYLYNNSLFFDYQSSIWLLFALFIAILLFKVVATSVTFGAGGIGGIFAPSLFLGSNTGLFFAKVANQFGVNLPYGNFALVGMAGLIAGVIHAPLTAIFLIAEITGGYQLFMPLMITATISYTATKIFESNSVYTIQLAKRGELITHDKDKAVLSLMRVSELIETNFKTIHPDATLGELVVVISKSTRNIYPVIEKDGTYLGNVLLDHIRHIIFKPEMYNEVYVRNLFYMPSVFVDPEDSMEEVAKKFQQTGNFNLVVLKDGKYFGFISRANVFSSYRKMLKHFSED